MTDLREARVVGLDELRKSVGAVCNDVRVSGHPIVVTRNGKPYVVITPYRVDGEFSGVSLSARQMIADLAEYRVQAEYGEDVTHGMRGAMMIAQAQLMQEMPDLDDRAAEMSQDQLRHLAVAVLRVKVEEALRLRLCQCTGFDGVCHHDRATIGACESHYEADVPETVGKRLCGPCHIEVNDWLDRNVAGGYRRPATGGPDH